MSMFLSIIVPGRGCCRGQFVVLYIDLVVVVIGTIAFAEFVVELHGGSWVSPFPGGSPLSL